MRTQSRNTSIMGEKKDSEDSTPQRRKRSLDPERSNSVDEGKNCPKVPMIKLTRGEDGEVIVCDVGDEESYEVGDTVYVENSRPDQPFYISTIIEYKVSKKDIVQVVVRFFYRQTEVPDSVYQPLVQDRNTQNKSGIDLVIQDPIVKNRELFSSDMYETYPITHLRGRCCVHHFSDIHAARDFTAEPDTFFFILGYNPETRRLASTQGEIRIGSSHQATLPPLQPLPEYSDDEEVTEFEELVWTPKTNDIDLNMYLQAARSMAAFVGMCDGRSHDEGCEMASKDDTTINALEALHENNYSYAKALQALVKNPVPVTVDRKWSHEDVKLFVRGLRQFGKNFFMIKTENLPHKETGELIEFYYYWKKTPEAATSRGCRRHRRHGLKKIKTEPKPPTPPCTDSMDLSSASEGDFDSDDSEKGLSGYACRHCFTTVSKDWHHGGQQRLLLCTECRCFFKKYGEMPTLPPPKDPPPYLFQPVKEEELAVEEKLRQKRQELADSSRVRSSSEPSSTLLQQSQRESSSSLGPPSRSSPSAMSSSSETGSAAPNRTKQVAESGSEPSASGSPVSVPDIKQEPEDDEEEKMAEPSTSNPSNNPGPQDIGVESMEKEASAELEAAVNSDPVTTTQNLESGQDHIVASVSQATVPSHTAQQSSLLPATNEPKPEALEVMVPNLVSLSRSDGKPGEMALSQQRGAGGLGIPPHLNRDPTMATPMSSEVKPTPLEASIGLPISQLVQQPKQDTISDAGIREIRDGMPQKAVSDVAHAGPTQSGMRPVGVLQSLPEVSTGVVSPVPVIKEVKVDLHKLKDPLQMRIVPDEQLVPGEAIPSTSTSVPPTLSIQTSEKSKEFHHQQEAIVSQINVFSGDKASLSSQSREVLETAQRREIMSNVIDATLSQLIKTEIERSEVMDARRAAEVERADKGRLGPPSGRQSEASREGTGMQAASSRMTAPSEQQIRPRHPPNYPHGYRYSGLPPYPGYPYSGIYPREGVEKPVHAVPGTARGDIAPDKELKPTVQASRDKLGDATHKPMSPKTPPLPPNTSSAQAGYPTIRETATIRTVLDHAVKAVPPTIQQGRDQPSSKQPDISHIPTEQCLKPTGDFFRRYMNAMSQSHEHSHLGTGSKDPKSTDGSPQRSGSVPREFSVGTSPFNSGSVQKEPSAGVIRGSSKEEAPLIERMLGREQGKGSLEGHQKYPPRSLPSVPPLHRDQAPPSREPPPLVKPPSLRPPPEKVYSRDRATLPPEASTGQGGLIRDPMLGVHLKKEPGIPLMDTRKLEETLKPPQPGGAHTSRSPQKSLPAPFRVKQEPKSPEVAPRPEDMSEEEKVAFYRRLQGYPPHSGMSYPSRTVVKTEPTETVGGSGGMPTIHNGKNSGATPGAEKTGQNSGHHGDNTCNQSPLVTPKVEPKEEAVQPREGITRQDQVDEVEDGVVARGPSPDPVVVDRNDHISGSARFIRHWYRGYNSCSRTDLVFAPLDNSKLAIKRQQQQERKDSRPPSTKSEKERQQENEKERFARKPDTPPANNTADAQISGPVDFQGPAREPAAYPYGVVQVAYPGHETPALRTLSEYARPHAGVQPPGMPPPGVVANHLMGPDPILRYQMETAIALGSRDAQIDLVERELREREVRTQELRHREAMELELREREMQERMKLITYEQAVRESAILAQNHAHNAALAQNAAMVQNVAIAQAQAQSASQSVALAAAAAGYPVPLERSHERHLPASSPYSSRDQPGPSNAERMAAERLSAERLSAERLHNERIHNERVALAQAQQQDRVRQTPASVARQLTPHHHSHSHSHTHLHFHPQEHIHHTYLSAGVMPPPNEGGLVPPPLHVVPPGPGVPPAHPIIAPNHPPGAAVPHPAGFFPPPPGAVIDPALAQQLQREHMQRMEMMGDRPPFH